MVDFINNVSRLILIAHEWNIDDALESGDVEKYYEYFDEYTSNFYEWTDVHNMVCPLFTLYDLRKHGADNYGLTQNEFEKIEKECKYACDRLLTNS